jgi:hypothetical protein
VSEVSIGALSGKIELEDEFSSKMDRIVEGVKNLDEKFGGFGHHFTEWTASFFTAEAALEAVKEAGHLAAEAIRDIVQEGSKAQDVEDAFNHLMGGADHAAEAIARLEKGTHGQIADTDLMLRVNQNLAAGLNLTGGQMDILTNAAYALSKAQKIDVAEAFDRVSNAMVTGRVRAIQLLTGRIDVTEAEERFAKSIGKTADHLNEAGKVEALRSAILEKLANVTDRVGETHERLADKVQRAQVYFHNLTEEIEIGIANSPVITTAYDAIHDALVSAFGIDQEALVANVTHKVEEGAIAVLGFAQHSVEAGKIVVETWYEVQNTYTHVVEGIQAITYAVENVILGVLKAANAMPGSMGTFNKEIEAVTGDIDRLYNSMAEGEGSVEKNRKAEEAWGKTLDTVGGVIKGIQDKMIAAQETEKEHLKTIEDSKTKRDGLNESIKTTGDYTKITAQDIKNEKAELDKAQMAWAAYDDLRAHRAGHSLDAERADIEKWHQDQITKLDLTTEAWVQHWNAIEATVKERLSQMGIDIAKLYDGSRQKRQDDLESAQKTYDEALANASAYSQEFLQKLRDDRDVAKDHLVMYGHESVAQLTKIEEKAKEVAASVWAITPPITMMLDKLDKSTFDRLGGDKRLKDIEEYYKQHPGAKSGGTGDTGIASGDEAGYRYLLQMQRDYEQLKQYADAHANDVNNKISPQTAQELARTTANGNPSSTTLAAGTSGGGSGGTVINHFYVNGTAEDVANKVSDILMQKAFLGRQFPQAGR